MPPPAVPVSSTPDTSDLSEFEQHKVARGFMPEPKRPTSPVVISDGEVSEVPREPVAASPAVATPAEPPELPEEPEPVPAEIKGPEAVSHRWKDPESGLTLDLRRRDHRKIKKLLEDRADLARQLADARGDLTRARSAPEPPLSAPQVMMGQPDPHDPEPALEQFADQGDPYAAYIGAQARWHARQQIREFQTERAGVERAQQVEQRIDTAQRAWDAKVPEVKTRYPDFDAAYGELFDSLTREGQEKSRPLVTFLLTSPVGHDVAYFLGNHPEEVSRLFGVPSLDAHLRAIGALEARVQQSLAAVPTPPLTTRTPAPTIPVNTGSPAGRRTAEQIAEAGDLAAWHTYRGRPVLAMR